MRREPAVSGYDPGARFSCSPSRALQLGCGRPRADRLTAPENFGGEGRGRGSRGAARGAGMRREAGRDQVPVGGGGAQRRPGRQVTVWTSDGPRSVPGKWECRSGEGKEGRKGKEGREGKGREGVGEGMRGEREEGGRIHSSGEERRLAGVRGGPGKVARGASGVGWGGGEEVGERGRAARGGPRASGLRSLNREVPPGCVRSLRSGGLGDRVPRLSAGGSRSGDSGPVPALSGSRSDHPNSYPLPPPPPPQSFGAASESPETSAGPVPAKTTFRVEMGSGLPN